MTDTTAPPRPTRSSIDLSLELEHQLAHEEGDVPKSPSSSILDPQILADLIIQLRASIATLTAERDHLSTELAAAHAREAEAQDARQLATERATTLENELDAAHTKAREDEEAISMLRTKVEESRRGVMRLQQESRRMSSQFQPGGPLALDLTAAARGVLNGPKSSKRNSFTPLTGTFKPMHSPQASTGSFPMSMRSTSDPGTDAESGPDAHSLHVPDRPPAHGRLSPPRTQPLSAELDALRKELVEARQDLQDVRAELQEATEAREASESCVRALREFIASGAAAGGADAPAGLGFSLPPLPTDAHVGDIDEEKPKGGWGIKLWRKDSTTAGVSPSIGHARSQSISARRDSDASASEASRPSIASLGSAFTWSKGGATATPPQNLAASPALSTRKFGSFFWSSPQAPAVPPKDDAASLVLSPTSQPARSLDDSSEDASEPTSPQELEGQELVVQYDDTLTDGSSIASAERVLTKVQEETGESTPRVAQHDTHVHAF